MPKCRKCNSQLNRYQKDMCPICGEKHPFNVDEDYTIDFTQEISQVGSDVPESKVLPKKKKVYCLFATFLGIFGIHLFYIKQKKNALIWLLMNMAALVLISLIVSFLMESAFGILITFGALYLFNLVFGITTFFRKDLKDGDGEFLI